MTTLFDLPQHHVFFLCSDKEYARGLRRHLVDACGVVYGQAGTLDELVELAHKKRLLDLYANEYDKGSIQSLLNDYPDAFWAKSAQHDPGGVAVTLSQCMEKVFLALGDHQDQAWEGFSDTPRVQTRLAEMQHLFEASYAGRCLPEWLQKTIEVIRCNHAPITPIKVLCSAQVKSVGPLIKQFLHILDKDCHSAIHANSDIASYQCALNTFDENTASAMGPAGSNLVTLQTDLYQTLQGKSAAWQPNDSSVQVIQCRDRIEGLEVLAGMIQQELSSDSALTQADFAVLLPQSFDSHAQLQRVFARAGLQLANLEYSAHERNLAGELLRYALMMFSGASPKLAVKSLLTNPLMPWSADSGHELAASIDRYGFNIKPPKGLRQKHLDLIELFNQDLPRSALCDALITLKSELNTEGLSDQQLANTESLFAKVMSDALDVTKSYDVLIESIDLTPINVNVRQAVFLDGVTVVYEGSHAWRGYEFLYVLDFVAGSFPAVSSNPVALSDSEWNELACLVPALELQRNQRAFAKQMLRNQLARARRKLTLIIPSFNELGDELKPSESLIDLAVIAGQLDDPHSLILDLANEHDRQMIEGLKQTADAIDWIARYQPEPQDLELNRNLLGLWMSQTKNNSTGEWETVVKPQSPSALDDLLICPLGWLLKQIGADPKVWEPDGFTPMTSGLIAHDVLEALFTGDGTLVPSDAEIEDKAPALFEHAIKKKAPYLNTAIWQVERNNLLAVVISAAKAWADLLIKLNARVVAPELWLQGTFDGHPIHGQTDCVISLPDQGVLVVDFKTSKADKYEKRMKAQVDLQASLYQEMLKTGGPKKPEDTEKARHANLKKLNGVLYFTLKDRLATSNYKPEQAINGLNTVNSHGIGEMAWSQDVSSQAMAWLRSRFNELRHGRVAMVKESEIEHYEKLGFGQFVFSLSPIIQRSIIRDIAAQDDDEGDEQ